METTKKPYVAPLTTVSDVELEGSFCVSHVEPGMEINERQRHIEIEQQPDGGTMDFSKGSWDE
ncbi:MAG: hypothetical protein LIO90_08435 [Bacteroidales bacterium]|nr:hypothetical protein [Bacteroidales bacterium]